MEEISGFVLLRALRIISELECELLHMRPAGDALFANPAHLTHKQRQAIYRKLEFSEVVLARMGLSNSAHAVSDFRQRLRVFNGPISNVSALEGVRELNSALEREIQAATLMIVAPIENPLYVNPTDGWENAVARWPKIAIDIEESGRSFACNRFAGAIFHVLLVAEFGVIELAKLFGVAGDKPGWACVERLQKIRDKKPGDRSPVEREFFALLEDTVPLMIAVKDSWRHKISHVDNRLVWLDVEFDAHVAEEIMIAVRGLMRRLATQLPVATQSVP